MDIPPMSSLQSVNPFYLAELLTPFFGRADVDEEVERYRTLDPNDEAAVRTIIRQSILPHVQRLTKDSVASIKLTLRYYLSGSGHPWYEVFESVLPPFGPPSDARDFVIDYRLMR